LGTLKAAGFQDAKRVLAQSFRGSVHLLQREDGSYGNFEGWTWFIQGDSDSEAAAWRQLIAHSKPSKKVIMPSDVAKKHFDQSLGVLKPEKRLG
jgi:hypothetical protein